MITAENLIHAQDFIREEWGDEAFKNIMEAINITTCVPMKSDEFMSHCIACGGNWGGMLLSGLKELYPLVWDAIPDEMGCFAYPLIVDVMKLCKVDTSER